MDQQTLESTQAMWDEMAAEESPGIESQVSNAVDLAAGSTESLDKTTAQVTAPDATGQQGNGDAPAESKPADQDPFAGLPDAVKQRLFKIDDIEKTNKELVDQLRTNTGRVSALQRELDLAKKAPVQAANAPSQEQIQDASKSPEKWKKLKADFEDWGEGIEEFVRSELNTFKAQQGSNPAFDPNQITNFVQGQIGFVQQSFAEQIEVAKLEFKHENWLTEINTPEFKAWMMNQPLETKALADSPKARDASKLLDLFASSKQQNINQIKEQRNARLEVAATQKGPSAPQPKSVEDMTEEELWNYEARLLEKRSAS